MTEQVLLGVFHLIGGYKEWTLFFLSQIKGRMKQETQCKRESHV